MRTPVLTLAAFAVITVGGGTYAARYVRADPSPAAERTPRLDGRTVVRLGDPRLLAGIPGAGPLELEEVRVWLNDPATNVPLMLELPAWLRPGAGQVKDLTDNPLTRGRIELGRQLFC